jgi:hypothetical protein
MAWWPSKHLLVMPSWQLGPYRKLLAARPLVVLSSTEQGTVNFGSY